MNSRATMKFRTAGTMLCAVLLIGAPASAHHSFGGAYDVSKELTIKGKIVQVTMRSPHSMFVVQSDEGAGSDHRWSIEAAAVSQFVKQGFEKDAFKAGEPVEVICNPTRTEGSTKARMVKITRTSDGKSAMFDLTGEALGPPSDPKK